MKIIDCEQGSPEWFSARCGIPTASNFDQIVTSKGTPSTQSKKYLHRLAGEAILGYPEETYQNADMIRGNELEQEARSVYELLTGEEVQQVGFCLTDICGASPDGLVGDKGMLEIKCPKLHTHVGYLLDNKLPTTYFQQVQGQLFVTEREWSDFFSYYPGMENLIVRVKRDDKFIKLLEGELKKFNKELEETITKLKGTK